MSHWTYYFRTVDCSNADILQPLEDTLLLNLIPSITDRNSPGEPERDLLALQTSMGGLGLPKPSMIAKMLFSFSTTICQPLIDLLREQLYVEVLDPLDCFLQQREIKRSISGQKINLNQERAKALYDTFSPEYMRIVELASEKGASSWLTVLPINS